jgi:hypothetical protein
MSFQAIYGDLEGDLMRKLFLLAAILAIPSIAQAQPFSFLPETSAVVDTEKQSSEEKFTLDAPAEEETPVYLQDRRNNGGRYLHQGTWELLVSAAGSSDTEFDNGGIGVNLGVGYFIADGLELGLRQNLSYASSNDNSSWNGSTRVAIDYHFDLDRWQPFIGANIGYIYGEDTHDTWAAGPEAGVKWFIKDEAFLYAIVEYQFYFNSSGDAEDNFDDGQWNYGVGVGFTF